MAKAAFEKRLEGAGAKLIHARPTALTSGFHAHPECMVFVPVRGEIGFGVRGVEGEWRVDAQSALVVRAGVEHRHAAAEEAEYVVVYTDDRRVSALASAREVALPAVGAWRFPNTVLVRELASELLGELSAQGRDAEACHAAMTLLVVVALRGVRRASAVEVEGLALDDERLARSVAAMKEGYREGVSTETLAALAGMSERSLERALVKATGLSPQRYQEALRLGEARRRLEAGKESVTTIAFDLGYQSLSHFVRRFRAVHGATPTSFVGGRGQRG